MTKAASIERLLDSATKSFGQIGYQGASLRAIAADAGVTLSAISVYFGDKAALYLAAKQRVARQIQDERQALIERAFAEGQGVPSQDGLISALVAPIIIRAVNSTEIDRYAIQLFRNAVLDQPKPVSAALMAGSGAIIARWTEGMQLAQPKLPRRSLDWAYSFVVAVALSGQVVDQRIRQHDPDETAADVAADVVAFCSAGITAMALRRGAGDPR